MAAQVITADIHSPINQQAGLKKQQLIQNNRVYGLGLKKDIPPRSLFHEGNKLSKKIMVSVLVT